MKKILTFSACLTLTFEAFANVYMDLNFSPNETSAVVSSDADCVQITVYKLTKVGANASSSQAFTGYYNASKKRVDSRTFHVHCSP